MISVSELLNSRTAYRLGISNTPNTELVWKNLMLTMSTLNLARNLFNRPITVTSGYRSEDLNKAVGGVSDSFHVLGLAADLVVSSELYSVLCDAIISASVIMKVGCKIIYEKEVDGIPSWLHVQFYPNSSNYYQIIKS